MPTLSKYLRKARMSKANGFNAPIVETPQEALQLARELGEGLQRLPGEERLPLLSDLGELKALLDGRVAQLDGELEAGREQLGRVRRGRQVCGAYARVVSLDSARARRRSPCP